MIITTTKAVLVAISIPIFSSQLEKSRDAVSVANMRSAYAEAATAYLTGTGEEGKVTVNKTDGAIDDIEVKNVQFKGTNPKDCFSGLATDLPFKPASGWTGEALEPTQGAHVLTFSWSGDNCTVEIN